MLQPKERVLTINAGNSGNSHVEVAIDTPAIEVKDGNVLFTMTISMTREFKHKGGNVQKELQPEDARQSKSELSWPNAREGSAMPSLFRLWYLCETDGAEWSIIDDNPISKSLCPKCDTLNSPIAIVSLPAEAASSDKTVSKFRMFRNLGSVDRD